MHQATDFLAALTALLVAATAFRAALQPWLPAAEKAARAFASRTRRAIAWVKRLTKL